MSALNLKSYYSWVELVRYSKGEFLDVVVGLRKDLETCGQWVGELLPEKNKKQFMINPILEMCKVEL